jgi:uncharacterized protein YciI
MHRLALVILLSVAALPAAALAAKPDAPPARSRYVVGLLWRGDAWTPERNAHTDSLQAGHMANLVRRYEEGWLVGSGPILDPASTLRGLFFFKADSVAQVTPLVATDPAIAAGRLKIDLVPWYGPAGLGDEYRRAHTTNPALKDSMVRYVVALTEPSSGKPRKTPDTKKKILSGPLADGRELAVLATADTSEARAWLGGSGDITTTLRPWMVARGVIPGH